MRLLILCDEPGLRTALEAQFRDHRRPVVWLRSGQLLAPEFATTDEPTLIVDCHGEDAVACAAWLPQDLLAQLAANCEEREWVWLLLSDSRVFPALSKRRFVETDAVGPTVRGGEQLLAREQHIAGNIARHVVLRTGPMIASRGRNLLTELVQQFRSGGAIAVPDAQRFCPTPVADVARVVAAILVQMECGAACWGTYHYESADPVTGYEFAEVALAAATQYWHVTEGHVQLRGSAMDSTADIFPLLNCQLIRDTFGIQQLPWRKIIPFMLKEIYAGQSSEISPL